MCAFVWITDGSDGFTADLSALQLRLSGPFVAGIITLNILLSSPTSSMDGELLHLMTKLAGKR